MTACCATMGPPARSSTLSSRKAAFAVWRKSGGGDWVRVGVVAPNTTAFSDTGLSPGTSYTYRVRATHGYYPSAWSNEAAGTTLPTAPAAPTDLTATVHSAFQI